MNISSYWLLGFVEGDGSFSYNRLRNSLVFVITQKGNKGLMHAIANFLHSATPQGVKSPLKDNVVSIYPDGEKWNLAVNHMEYIEHIIIPLFNSVIFRSKKYLDYLDWVTIFNILKKGLHYLPEGKKLIEQILSQMNSNRLSTSGKLIPKIDRDLLLSDIAKFLTKSSNYEYRENGSIWIISENRYLGGSKEGGRKKVVALLSSGGTILKYFDSVTECAKILGIPRSTLSGKLQKNQFILYENEKCLIVKVDPAELESTIRAVS